MRVVRRRCPAVELALSSMRRGNRSSGTADLNRGCSSAAIMR